ncbi:hypothetical protein Tco_0319316 [Tanacetum coccineum]
MKTKRTLVVVAGDGRDGVEVAVVAAVVVKVACGVMTTAMKRECGDGGWRLSRSVVVVRRLLARDGRGGVDGSEMVGRGDGSHGGGKEGVVESGARRLLEEEADDGGWSRCVETSEFLLTTSKYQRDDVIDFGDDVTVADTEKPIEDYAGSRRHDLYGTTS